VAAELVGGIHLEGWESTLLVGLILGLLNAIVRPILVLISLPLTVITLGLFLLVLNTAMLGLTAWIAGKFDDILFAIDGFWPAFFGALIISVVSWVLGMFIGPGRMARSIVH
jgi:putative membrane protein